MSFFLTDFKCKISIEENYEKENSGYKFIQQLQCVKKTKEKSHGKPEYIGKL